MGFHARCRVKKQRFGNCPKKQRFAIITIGYAIPVPLTGINAIQPGTIVKDFANPNKILGTVVNEVGRSIRTIKASPLTGAVLSQLIQIKIRPNNINYSFPYDYNSPPTGTLYSGDFTNSVSFTPTATYSSGSSQTSFTLYKINTYYDFV
tara:strand:+ start:88 stop:537 length:450 start_codon:yes stop_codon:yes gene_type:complete